jgi:hypothetical protein
MRKFVGYIKGIPSRIKNQWRNLFNSKEKKMSQGADEMYQARPHAHGDNWRRPEQHHNSERPQKKD